ncbi:hypothetical protein WN55_09857 [Dufourea novaeangliae]|uniref:Uncharacterized protein n=1 Tax=Dufourea novaeangliae TaxID=178035 RepID=A0A154P7P1_DUFNO|nr:hypothetical protein WN55_09857 [Dufourea novaeangliae]
MEGLVCPFFRLRSVDEDYGLLTNRFSEFYESFSILEGFRDSASGFFCSPYGPLSLERISRRN